jgi:GNAT superfamily N-acetyltransferase
MSLYSTPSKDNLVIVIDDKFVSATEIIELSNACDIELDTEDLETFKPSYIGTVKTKDNKLIASIGASFVMSRTLYVPFIMVHPFYRNKSIARELGIRFFEHLKDLGYKKYIAFIDIEEGVFSMLDFYKHVNIESTPARLIRRNINVEIQNLKNK